MDLSMIVEILSIIAVVSGLVFAGIELRQYRLSRERESAIELFSTFQSPEFARGVRTIAQLPDDMNKEQVGELVGEGLDDIYFVITSIEGMGVLVKRGELNLALVEDFFSGIVVLTWKKMRWMIEDERKALKRETWGEWGQWLAERIMEREKTRKAVPAYIEHKDWKPRR